MKRGNIKLQDTKKGLQDKNGATESGRINMNEQQFKNKN